MSDKILTRLKDSSRVEIVDKKCTNKWKWEWMEQSVVVDINDILHSASWKCGPLTINLKDDIRKVHFFLFHVVIFNLAKCFMHLTS